jgi:hypothetical protein
MRTFIIGDVHGMAVELRALVLKLRPEAGDRFAFLGDYVDKGPQSVEALQYVRQLVDLYPGSVALAGNHEESVMRLWVKFEKKGTWDGLRKVVREPWIKDLPASDLEWMRQLPLVARPRPGVVLVHGGMFPAYFEKHNEIGDVPTAWHKGGGKKMDRMRRFLRTRHVYRPGVERNGKSVAGNMVTLGDEGEDTQFWAESYDGREGFAFFGHAPQKNGQPLAYEHALGLDTGAVFGGNLTAYVLEDGQHPKAGRSVQVKADRAYAEWLEAFEAD